MNAVLDFPQLLPDAEVAPAVPQDIADISAGKAVVKLNATESGLALLRADLHGKSYDLTTTKGNDAARADRKRCVDLRTALEKKRKAMKAPALDFGRLIDSEAARITAEIVKLEDPINAAIKTDEDRREAERQERARIEATRIAGLKGQADAIMRGWLGRCGEADMTAERIGKGIKQFNVLTVPADLADVADYWSAQQSITLGRMQTMQSDLARREEAAHLAAERAELERQRVELEAQQAAARAELARLEQERKSAEEAAKFAAFSASMTSAIEQAQRTDEIVPVAELDTQEQEPQQVLKAEPATADATDRATPANASPDGGPMGVEQPAAAGLAGEEQAQEVVAENHLQQQANSHVADAAAGAGAEAIRPADDAPAAQAFALTPEPTDLLGDTDTATQQTTEQAARALLDHIAEAFTGRFPSDPKPGRAWFATLKTLACNLNDTL